MKVSAVIPTFIFKTKWRLKQKLTLLLNKLLAAKRWIWNEI